MVALVVQIRDVGKLGSKKVVDHDHHVVEYWKSSLLGALSLWVVTPH